MSKFRSLGLNVEEADVMAELAASRDTCKALLKAIDYMVSYQEAEVIRMSSAKGPDELYRSKLTAEGSRKLLTELQKLLQK